MRNSCEVTRLLLLSVIRKKTWPVLLLIGILIVIVSFSMVYPYEPALAVHMTAYGQTLLTIIFLMLGISITHEAKRVHCEEISITYELKGYFLLRCQLLLLIGLCLLVTGIIIGFIYTAALLGQPAIWQKQVILHIILLYFFPCYAMTVWGMLMAQLNTGRSVYLPALLGWIVTSSLVVDMNGFFSTLGGSSIRMWQTILSMGISNMRDVQGSVMTPPIELPWWIMRIIVCMFLTMLLFINQIRCRKVVPRRRRIWSAVLFLTVFIGIAIVIYASSRYEVFFSRFSDSEVRTEYTISKSKEYVPGKLVSLNEWPEEKRIVLQKTEIDLSCTTLGIQAEVQMTATMSENANEQVFTLYSDLVVDAVQIDGSDVSFERSHDGLLVRFPAEKSTGDVVVFRFLYHGYSLPVFPANETTVQLNRAFPWFPWPGIKRTSRYSNFYDYDRSEEFFIEEWQRGDEVEYILHYCGPGDLYTNLKASEQNGLYYGKSSSGVSLYSGMFHAYINGIDVYVPGSQCQQTAVAVFALIDAYPSIADLCEKLNSPITPQVPKTILLIEMKPPILFSYPVICPSEVYAWNDEWEIHQTSTSATLNTRNYYGNNQADYQRSLHASVYMPITYVLSTSSGFPMKISHSSVVNFSQWLSYYMCVRWNQKHPESEIQLDTNESFGTVGTGELGDYIDGSLYLLPSVTRSTQEKKEAIMLRMANGESFDNAFNALYQKLLQGDTLHPEDFITILYENGGI